MSQLLKHLDLFSGIGLFSYVADYVWNLEHVFCEIEDWPYRFLKQEYPNARIERDIKTFDGTEHAGKTFLLTAGVPCQPASVAGKRQGTEDDRWLWPEALRVMAEAQPEWCIFENPLGILTLEKGLVFENLLLKMESQGYAVQPYIIPACAIGAVHRRDRIWIIANYNRIIRRAGRNIESRKQSRYRKKIKRKISRSRFIANPSITRSGELSESASWDDPADFERSGGTVTHSESRKAHTAEQGGFHTELGGKSRDASDPNRFNGNNAGHGSGQVRGELWKEAEIQGRTDVANTENSGLEGRPRNERKKNGSRFRQEDWQKPWPEVATELCRMDVSSTDRVHRLKALGNTIQWEVAMMIMQGIDAKL